MRAQRGSDRIIDSVILAERFWEKKVTDKEVKVGEEAKVESLAKASEEPVAAE